MPAELYTSFYWPGGARTMAGRLAAMFECWANKKKGIGCCVQFYLVPQSSLFLGWYHVRSSFCKAVQEPRTSQVAHNMIVDHSRLFVLPNPPWFCVFRSMFWSYNLYMVHPGDCSSTSGSRMSRPMSGSKTHGNGWEIIPDLVLEALDCARMTRYWSSNTDIRS